MELKCTEKRLSELSVNEFLELEQTRQKMEIPNSQCQKNGKNYEYGISGLTRIFGCSPSTASRIKRSGKIDAAITQTGRVIVIDSELALELAKKKIGGRK